MKVITQRTLMMKLLILTMQIVANEEPIRIIENGLSDSEKKRLLRLREALEGDKETKTKKKLR